MTPQERQLVTDLFERLERLEGAPRDRDAEAAIAEGLRRAPNALYPLVQTVLVQDEALKRADARIRELEDALDQIDQSQAKQGGFLESMRDSLFGGRDERRGSVPSVRPGDAPMGAPPGFRTGASSPYGAPAQEAAGPGAMGGSFLGSAAATAAGVIGGAMMLQGIRSMFGDKHGAFGALGSGSASGGAAPWGGSGTDVPPDLARQVKLDDLVGKDTSRGDDSHRQDQSYALADDADQDDDGEDDEFDEDFAGDFDGGDSDTA